MSVGRSKVFGPRPRTPSWPLRVHELAVVGEAVDHVQLIVDDPDVLLGIVRADLDLVRPAPARQLLEQLVVLRPLVDEVALPVDDEDRVLEPPLPAALGGRLAGRGEAVGVAGRVAARRRERRVRRPRLGVRGQRQLAAHRDPDPVRDFRRRRRRTIPTSSRRANGACRAAASASSRRPVGAGRPVLETLPHARRGAGSHRPRSAGLLQPASVISAATVTVQRALSLFNVIVNHPIARQSATKARKHEREFLGARRKVNFWEGQPRSAQRTQSRRFCLCNLGGLCG